MDIVLFQEITTNEVLHKLEEEGKKYEGLYVDMDNKDERKYVKDNAQLIGSLLKKLDRSRIDKARDYKASVEKEAGEIKQRLEAANLPFTLLIDEHKASRAKILAEKKAKEDAAELVLQIEAGHEHALMMDKVQTFERAEREQARIDNEARIASEAVEKALEQERYIQEANANRIKQEAAKREADKAHVGGVRKAAKESLMERGLDEATAKLVVMAIHAGLIANVTINY
jgi:hypothetical protein